MTLADSYQRPQKQVKLSAKRSASKKAVPAVENATREIHFVDLSSGEELEQKESFTNAEEA